MKINILQNGKIVKVSMLVIMITFIFSCNKDLPVATPIIYSTANNSATTIGAAISSDTSYSFFKAAATKAGVLGVLSDSSKVFTVFLPNNNAFRISGIPSVAVVNSLPLSMLVPLIQYHIVPGEQYASANIPTTFPNIQLPSYFTIGALPGTSIPLKMSTFPSVRTNGFWDNNIPVVAPDMKFSNGVVHLVAALVAPPAQVLKTAIYSNPNLTYFKAAVARADSGQAGLNRIDSLLGYAVTNMTVLAPNDAAFQTLIFGLVFQGYLDNVSQYHPPTGSDTSNAVATANGAVAAGPAFLSTNNITSAQVQGILAYHLLATRNPNAGGAFQPNIRAFSVNFSSTPTLYPTLVNSVYSTHPGILGQATFTGPFVTRLQFTGVGTFPPGGTPFSGAPATAVSLDNHCVNGVYYIIDKVLLPQ